MTNLKIPTPEQAREYGRKGGQVSAQLKAERKALKKILIDLLHDKVTVDDVETTAIEQVALALMQKALTGDCRAFELIRDTIGEKPIDKLEITQYDKILSDMNPEQRKELALKMGKELGLFE